jgi:hypothetical protein
VISRPLIVILTALGVLGSCAVIFGVVFLSQNPERLKLWAQSERLYQPRVQGEAAPWALVAPSPAWRKLRPEHARKLNPRADVWLVRPDLDAHLAVFVVESRFGGWDVPRTMAAELKEAIEGAKSHQLFSEGPVETELADAWQLHYRVQRPPRHTEHLYAGFAQEGTLYLVQGWTRRDRFAEVEAELRQALSTFTVPLSAYQKAQNGLTRRMRALPGFTDWLAAQEQDGSTPAALGQGLSLEGLKRLDLASLERRTALLRRMVKRARPEECVAFARGTADGPVVKAALERLGPDDLQAWMDLTLTAVEAALRDAPRVTLTDAQWQAAHAQLFPPGDPELQRIVTVMNDPDAADDDLCWAERRLLDRIFELPPETRRGVLPLLQQ